MALPLDEQGLPRVVVVVVVVVVLQSSLLACRAAADTTDAGSSSAPCRYNIADYAVERAGDGAVARRELNAY